MSDVAWQMSLQGHREAKDPKNGKVSFHLLKISRWLINRTFGFLRCSLSSSKSLENIVDKLAMAIIAAQPKHKACVCR